MIIKIVEQFNQVNNSYENLVQLTEKTFSCLKTKNFKDLDACNKQEILRTVELKERLSNLKEIIIKECEDKGIEEGKLSALFPFMTIEEKENVMACQKTAFHYEQKLKDNLKMNNCLAQAMMQTTKTVVDSWVYFANEERKNGNTLINKKF